MHVVVRICDTDIYVTVPVTGSVFKQIALAEAPRPEGNIKLWRHKTKHFLPHRQNQQVREIWDTEHILSLSQISDNYTQLKLDSPVEPGTQKFQLIPFGLWALRRKWNTGEKKTEGDVWMEYWTVLLHITETQVYIYVILI